MIRRVALAVVVLATVGLATASAQGGPGYTPQFDIPPRPNPPRLVNDYTGTLAAAERDALERKLVAYDDSTSTQIAVVLVPTTDGVAPVDYATEILRAWGVGQAGLDNGVVLLVATEDRELFITTGFGAEGALTDARAGRIVRDILVPSFRQGQFFAGIDRATDAMMAALAGEFEAAPARSPGGDGGLGSALLLVLFIFVILVLLSSRHKGGPSPPGNSRSRGRSRRGPSVIVLPGFGSSGGGGFGGGFGGGGFGGGGFGGFGGGFGGGGGAGGGW
ncbi:MAG: TPM domain-containing protein [Bacteroidota bacterium]